MKKLYSFFILICSFLTSCSLTNEFYNPEITCIVNSQNVLDTLHYKKCYDLELLNPRLFCIDDYLIIRHTSRKDSVFTVLNMVKDSVETVFGEYGHATNEFTAIQPWAYTCRGEYGEPLFYIPEVKTTKVIDIKETVKENKCVVKKILKEKSDMYFYHTYHVKPNEDFVYKRVSYKDARDAVYVQPEFSLKGKEEYSWELYPNIITPAFSNLMDGAYANKIVVKPDGKKVIDMLSFLDK